MTSLFTGNPAAQDTGPCMGDPILATAILDRLLHHSHIANIRGNSYRLREKMRTGAYGSPSTT
uniref:ATP-binding protein n=1 Tax=Brevibacillus agri TaxID=51101 RepID=UPI0035BE5393